mgnify:CR=1 FL=1|jgi:hypothetical protein
MCWHTIYIPNPDSQPAKTNKGKGRGKGRLSLAAKFTAPPEPIKDSHSQLSGLTATPGTESLNATRLQLLTPTLQNDEEHLPSSPRTVSHVPMDVSASEMSEETVKSKGVSVSRSAVEVYLLMWLKCSIK